MNLPQIVPRLIIAQVSREGTSFDVPREVALLSQLVKETLGVDEEDDEVGDEKPSIPLLNVSSDTLEKVIEFCTHYLEEPMTPIETPLKSTRLEEIVQAWYAEFVKVDRNLLFTLVAAANFMDVKPVRIVFFALVVKARLTRLQNSCSI
mgnify:CR=1 FL=1